MNDYLFLMHDATTGSDSGRDWERYLTKLRASGHFSGGSEIGGGVCVSKSGVTASVTAHLSGYMRVQADSIEEARELLQGNPVFEAGGTVEIRELPRS